MPTKNRQQLLIIAALSVIGLFAADQFVIEPLIKLWKARETRIAELRQSVLAGKQLQLRERSIRGYWRDISERTLTNNPSAAEHRVFEAIDHWAQGSGATIASINPQWRHDTEDYMTYECRVDATGNLGTLTQFLYNLEKEPMALRLQSVDLGVRDKEGQQLSVNLQFSGLILTPQKP